MLQTLIRNRCVSSGFPSTGNESVNATVLRDIVEGSGIDTSWHELAPGRGHLVARISGSDASAPSLCLMGHTDVVDADASGWDRDPFGGEIVDGEVWGRGAVDMLNQTAAMALTMRHLADDGFRPRGDLVFWAVPDEECGGFAGAKQLIDATPQAVLTDYAITEVGGAISRTTGGPVLVEATVADKGAGGAMIRVVGDSGHASLPHGHANAVVRAAEVVGRIDAWQHPVRISEDWRRWVATQPFTPEVAAALSEVDHLDEVLPSLEPHVAAHAHACTRCTMAPTIIHGGDTINMFPSEVVVVVNVRTIQGDDTAAIHRELVELLSDLVQPEDVMFQVTEATASPKDTPLWDTLERVTQAAYQGAALVPGLLAAQTDARWTRPAGVTTYGYGLLSERVDPREYWSRFHGANERCDIDSLALTAQAYRRVAEDFLA
ncbi:MAG: M20/M25/M40 family metallo-hydrolase [Nocardioidaceae bacterium]|nr:M20/M25/M40 family metallo-hydrolase [Nocardioidaceae bacterium]